MPEEIENLALRWRTVGGWRVPAVEFTDAARKPLCLAVCGRIANSISDGEAGRAKTKKWKVLIASEVKAARGGGAWSPDCNYAISIGFKFFPGYHGYRNLDVENFIKPVIDAIAAGLFCDDDTDPNDIQRWNYDDSNFNTLLIHRLPNTRHAREEGVALFVAASER